jgi:ATP-dependent RNA helicase DDX52/ROK1
VEYLVLDESDKLFELGFVEQIDLVVKACSSPSIVRSLFSATLPETVEELARSIMHDAVRVIIGRKYVTYNWEKQIFYFLKQFCLLI